MNTSIKSVKKAFFFETEDGYEVLIDKFEDGFAECAVPVYAEPEGSSIVIWALEVEKFIKFIYGCFEQDSNFKEVLLEVFGCPSDSKFIGIKIKLEDAEDVYRTITAENSAIFDIWKLLGELVKEYVAILTKNMNDNIKEESEKTERFNDMISTLRVEFSNNETEKIYCEESEDEDEGAIFYSKLFVAYVQYLIKNERISIQEAIEDTYDMFEELELDLYIPEPNEIQLICEYCKYGNEIYQGVVNFLLRRFNDELKYL